MAGSVISWRRHAAPQGPMYLFDMSSRPLDTAPAAWSRHEAIIERMDGPARLHVAVELSEAMREIRLAGIRARHPELNHREAVARLVAEEYGVELPRQR